MNGLDVITIGETMVLFDPVFDGPIRYVDTFRKRIGGAESNVAIGLARLNKKVGWISQLGEDALGDYVQAFIRGENVDTSRVVRTNKAQTGLYIKERVREGHVNVCYYRKGSAASLLTMEKIDWEYIKQAKIIHITGITALLSESCWEVSKQLFSFAKQNGIMTSFDPNIRKKLWDNPIIAKERLLYLAEQSDILLSGIDEAATLLNTEDINEILAYFRDKNVACVVLKDGANGVHYAMAGSEGGFIPSYKVERVVDPVGAGDGFAAGVLAALLEKQSLEEAVRLGTVIGAMVVSTYGDVEGLPDKQMMEQFMYGKHDVIR